MSDTNNKIVDIDGVELEIGCRVAFAINQYSNRCCKLRNKVQ